MDIRHWFIHSLVLNVQDLLCFLLINFEEGKFSCSHQYTCFTLWGEKENWRQTGGRQRTQVIEEGVEVFVLTLHHVSIWQYGRTTTLENTL